MIGEESKAREKGNWRRIREINIVDLREYDFYSLLVMNLVLYAYDLKYTS